MRVLFDGDILLEYFFEISQVKQDFKELLLKIAVSPRFEFYVTYCCLEKIRFCATNKKGKKFGELIASKAAAIFNNSCIIHVDSNIRKKAKKFSLKDFDSAIELASAIDNKLDAIITLKPDHFDKSDIKIFTLQQFLKESYKISTTLSEATYYHRISYLDYLVMPDGFEQPYGSDLLTKLHSGKVFMINSRRRNGLILFKAYHAEFAGPGTAVGGDYDRDCMHVLPIGNISSMLLKTISFEERQKSYLIRRQWIRLIKSITENPVPQQRVQKMIDQLEQYFPSEVVSQLPNEAFAMLVGVLPTTVAIVRRMDYDCIIEP